MVKLKDILKLTHPAQIVKVNSVLDSRDYCMESEEALSIWADKDVLNIEAQCDDLYITVE